MRKTFIAGIVMALSVALPAQAEVKINPGPVKGVTIVKENARGTVWCEIVPMVGTPPNAVMHIYKSLPPSSRCPRSS
jgi:hypothetical protein